MNDIQTKLTKLLELGWQQNPALVALIGDYVRSHVIVALLSGGFALVLFLICIQAVVGLLRSKKLPNRGWTNPQKIQLWLSVLSGLVGTFMALIATVNALTALSPTEGFSLAAGATTTSINSSVGQALIVWLDSGSQKIPAALEQAVSRRTNWQQPKAMISWGLFVVFGFFGTRIWQALMMQPQREARGYFGFRLVSGVFTFGACSVLMLMAVANTANGFAPLAISVLGAGG